MQTTKVFFMGAASVVQEQSCHQARRARSHEGQPANGEAACHERIMPRCWFAPVCRQKWM